MNISELTERVYAEGVEKGNQKAAEIIQQAEDKANAIVADAQKKAQEMVSAAERQAAELTSNTHAELKLYTAQALNALKTEITDVINGEIAGSNVKAATVDPKFMQKLIADMAAQMAKSGEVVIEAKDADALRKYFAANAKNLLDKGVEIREVKGIKTAFTIAPAKGGYKLAFGDDEFIAYFKEFLRPQLIELLF